MSWRLVRTWKVRCPNCHGRPTRTFEGPWSRTKRPRVVWTCPTCKGTGEVDVQLAGETDKTEAAEREANELRAKLAAVDAEAYERWEIGVQPDTEGGDADAHRPRGHEAIPVAEGAAVDDGRALSEHWREQAREAAMHSPEYGEQAAWEAARLAEALRAYAAQEDTYADQAGNAVEFGHRAACHRECAADLRRAAELLSAPTQPDLLEQAAQWCKEKAGEDEALERQCRDEARADQIRRSTLRQAAEMHGGCAFAFREAAQYLRRMALEGRD